MRAKLTSSCGASSRTRSSLELVSHRCRSCPTFQIPPSWRGVASLCARPLAVGPLPGSPPCFGAIASAARNRFASACRSFHPMAPFLSTSGRNSQNVSP